MERMTGNGDGGNDRLAPSADTSPTFAPSKQDQRLLLHACCGPCAEFPARDLLAEGFYLRLYFYNPNIHPQAEHDRRRDNLLNLAQILSVPIDVDEACDEAAWRAMEAPERCRMCYRVRLDAAARHAAALGIPRFTTTLLISPYQDHEALKTIGEEVAAKHGVTFLYRDFRPHFREGQRLAKEDELYRQKYCGCIRSLEDSPFKEKITRDLANLTSAAAALDPSAGQSVSGNDHK